jgi:hypothetical protein
MPGSLLLVRLGPRGTFGHRVKRANTTFDYHYVEEVSIAEEKSLQLDVAALTKQLRVMNEKAENMDMELKMLMHAGENESQSRPREAEE